MSLIDTVLGQGAIDGTFSDWDTARDFVIFTAIINNPRLSDAEKVQLQTIEEEAVAQTKGQFLKSEKQEIGEYFNYLKNQFPSVTDDQRFLAIFDAADEVQAAEPSVSPQDIIEDFELPDPVKEGSSKLLLYLGVAGLVFAFSLARR